MANEPWLIFAALINKATIGLFQDAPVGKRFGQFVQDAQATMLGVVPTLVWSWRTSGCMESFDWSAIRCFSSTGEASNPDDMFYLSSLANFRPVIEYCGGTEVGGAYISSTVIQPNAPSTSSTSAVGSCFEILDEDYQLAEEGELFLIPPALGLSRRLANRDHDAIYYDLPRSPTDNVLRRHGDRFQRLAGGYFLAGGRADDTMNLGGIKVSAAEIETIVNQQCGIVESAAVGKPMGDSGPDSLVVFVVCDENGSKDESICDRLNQSIRAQLNPLIKIAEVRALRCLPRTASNKVMRRTLRAWIS